MKMQRNYYWLYFMYLLIFVAFCECSWGTPGSSQYHIQTDEGPERYFRFQTDNGQFRKEKRLQDGTVIGTEAWIDAAGFLRQKDYIADKDGYRILKSKVVFVGNGRPIDEAIKLAKSSSSSSSRSNILTNGGQGLKNSINGNFAYSTTPIPYSTTTTSTTTTTTTPSPTISTKLNYLSPQEVALVIKPSNQLGFDHYPDELARARGQQDDQTNLINSNIPNVEIRTHSEPYDDNSNSIIDNGYNYIASTTERPLDLGPSLPSLSIEPPYLNNNNRHIRPIALTTTTPTPIPATQSTYHISSTTPNSIGYQYSAHSQLPINIDNMDGILLPPLQSTYRRRLRPTPIPTPQPPTPSLQNNAIDYETPLYGGYSVQGNNGFRYVLPKQYHEEEQIDDRKRAGSYGYVDPFGIRRVVYYHASPEQGFIHRNNNQYVGFNAPPYDPSPNQPTH